MPEKTDDLLVAVESEAGEEEILRLVAKFNCQPDEARLQKALVSASLKGLVSSMDALLKFGVPADARGDGGQLALLGAAENGQVAAVKLLCEKGANIEQKDGGGFTSMNHAIKGNHMDVVKELMRLGAKVSPSEKGAGVAAAVREAQVEALIKHLKSAANLHVDPKEMLEADEAVWIAMRKQMALVRRKEEQKAGAVVVDLEERLKSELAMAAKAKVDEGKVAAELEEKRIAMQNTQNEITAVGKEIDDVVGQQYRLRDSHDKMAAEYRGVQAELKEALKQKEDAEAVFNAKTELRDQLLAQQRAVEDENVAEQRQNDLLKSELAAARADLAGWIRDKETAARLTAKAQKLLGVAEPDTPQ